VSDCPDGDRPGWLPLMTTGPVALTTDRQQPTEPMIYLFGACADW
jgi:hypothetical protein